MAGGKRGLQIVSPGQPIHVQQLPAEIKSSKLAALHGVRDHLAHLHAAAGDNRLGQGARSEQRIGEGFQQPQQRLAFPRRDLMALLLGIDAAAPDQNRALKSRSSRWSSVLASRPGLRSISAR